MSDVGEGYDPDMGTQQLPSYAVPPQFAGQIAEGSDNLRELGALLMEECGYEPGDSAEHSANNDLVEDRVEFVFKALDIVRHHMTPHTLTVVEQTASTDLPVEWVDKDNDIWQEVPQEPQLLCVTDLQGNRLSIEDMQNTPPTPRSVVEDSWGPLRLKETNRGEQPLCSCGAPVDSTIGVCRNGHPNTWVLKRIVQRREP